MADMVRICDRDLPLEDVVKLDERQDIVFVLTTSAAVLSVHPERDKDAIERLRDHLAEPA